MAIRSNAVFCVLFFLALMSGSVGDTTDFARRTYTPHPLPDFARVRAQLPAPIYAENPRWIELYWRAWELAFVNFHEPAPGSGFVSQFVDAAFSENIYLWDTCFLTMFTSYAHPLVPGIGSLDNFYAKQHADGEICREIIRATGADYPAWVNREGHDLFSRWGWSAFQPGRGPRRLAPVIYRDRIAPSPAPVLTLDALNHPILAWAELESYRITGDLSRLGVVYEPLVRYYRAIQKYLQQGNGLYITDWAAMDDSPRNPLLAGGGTGVDISCEMVLFARDLATIARLLHRPLPAADFSREADQLSRLINDRMWDPARGFYFDLTLDGERTSIKTIAAFWALLAGVADPAQARQLVLELTDPKTFNRVHRVPTVAGDEATFNPKGYWRGGVWAPTTTMVVRGLERSGFEPLAREIALNHLANVGRVFEQTGTIWENYAADSVAPGHPSRRDFVGWSGLGPIRFLLEYAIGLKPDAANNELRWVLNSPQRQGCERYRFNGHVVSLWAEPARPGSAQFEITVESDGAFTLRLEHAGATLVRQVTAGMRQTIRF